MDLADLLTALPRPPIIASILDSLGFDEQQQEAVQSAVEGWASDAGIGREEGEGTSGGWKEEASSLLDAFTSEFPSMVVSISSASLSSSETTSSASPAPSATGTFQASATPSLATTTSYSPASSFASSFSSSSSSFSAPSSPTLSTVTLSASRQTTTSSPPTSTGELRSSARVFSFSTQVKVVSSGEATASAARSSPAEETSLSVERSSAGLSATLSSISSPSSTALHSTSSSSSASNTIEAVNAAASSSSPSPSSASSSSNGGLSPSQIGALAGSLVGAALLALLLFFLFCRRRRRQKQAVRYDAVGTSTSAAGAGAEEEARPEMAQLRREYGGRGGMMRSEYSRLARQDDGVDPFSDPAAVALARHALQVDEEGEEVLRPSLARSTSRQSAGYGALSDTPPSPALLSTAQGYTPPPPRASLNARAIPLLSGFSAATPLVGVVPPTPATSDVSSSAPRSTEQDKNRPRENLEGLFDGAAKNPFEKEGDESSDGEGTAVDGGGRTPTGEQSAGWGFAAKAAGGWRGVKKGEGENPFFGGRRAGELVAGEGTATFTVRILVNSHEVSETKSVKDGSFTWTASSVSVGDQVQVWVYDSAGEQGKTAQISVVEKSSGSSSSSKKGGGDGESTTKKPSETGSNTQSGGGEDGGGGSKTAENGSSQTGGAGGGDEKSGGGGSATKSGGGGGPTGSGGASLSGGGGASSVAKSTTAVEKSAGAENDASASAVATAAATQGATNVNSVDVTLGGDSSSSTSTASSDTASTDSDKTILYFGIGGLVLALIIGLTLCLYVP
ncbi:hypothetical protein JCM8547_000947 [Rhodosporidiobolus lusitaniae]